MTVTATDQQTALQAAATAVRDLLALRPDARAADHTDQGLDTNDAVEEAQRQRAWNRAYAAASRAVTAAVTAADVSHGQICTLTGAPGLLVVGLITDDLAQADALRVEQHRAERYVEEVRQERVRAAQRLRGPESTPRRPKQDVASMLGVSRPTLDKWLADA